MPLGCWLLHNFRHIFRYVEKDNQGRVEQYTFSLSLQISLCMHGYLCMRICFPFMYACMCVCACLYVHDFAPVSRSVQVRVFAIVPVDGDVFISRPACELLLVSEERANCMCTYLSMYARIHVFMCAVYRRGRVRARMRLHLSTLVCTYALLRPASISLGADRYVSVKSDVCQFVLWCIVARILRPPYVNKQAFARVYVRVCRSVPMWKCLRMRVFVRVSGTCWCASLCAYVYLRLCVSMSVYVCVPVLLYALCSGVRC